MNLDLLKEYYNKHQGVEALVSIIKEKDAKSFLKGLCGSSRSFVASSVFSRQDESFLFILNDKEEAAYFLNDLENIAGSEHTLFFPASYKRQIHHEKLDTGSIVLRAEVLNKLSDETGKKLIVTYAGALAEKVISKSRLEENTLHLAKGDSVSLGFITELLHEFEFERTDFVYEPGQYSVRGGIVDIFSFSHDKPYRIDFFGDDVESIRTFDVDTQLSLETLEEIAIVPNIQNSKIASKENSFLDYLPENTLVWIDNLEIVRSTVIQLLENYDQKYRISEDGEEGLPAKEFLIDADQLTKKLQDFRVLEFGQQAYFKSQETITFNTAPQPVFNKNFELLSENLLDNYREGYQNLIFSNSQKQLDRLQSIFNELNNDEVEEFTGILMPIHEGFIDHELNICFYTDHQIFERYHKFRLRSSFAKKEAISIKEINGLQPGDYVVHADHGIGRFGGLTKIEKNGKFQEAIRLIYRDDDILYVGIHNLHRISKYKGKDAEPPRIYKLGSGAWQRLTQRTKSKVKDIARELIMLYAQRKSKEGFAYSPDSYLQNELEASFIYEDTPDQVKTTSSVKTDMEALMPMDRLVCGDVGFGKTEIAIRAAFKAVTDSKQVAILVPTTILAMQHYYTFKDRLKDFPCSVDYVSRLRKPKDQKHALSKLKNGELDIIIGTHRLVGKDVEFKDLGLLIVDEEQKFGVAVKEKLKAFKVNVDTLTLTATPIPRTLQFSMMGARDLSIINTPPPNRYPIVTELGTFDPELIREAIEYEVERNGQVFVIHNRIQNIFDVEALINKVCPKVKTVVGHGQMDGKKLEEIMLAFIDGDYDVLVATTIIESGLDIPNANTIIINNAQNFGLSDLHQLRGRVGRSNKKAFCYLITPPVHSLKPDARRRLKAIEDFSELGSGFNIAMQDLDIRGAGNLLGAEQSGFISDIGFETYHRILDEAMLELRDTEFKDLFSDKEEDTPDIRYVNDCNIETDMEILFPDDYIRNITERLNMYRELDKIAEEYDLQRFELRLVDRFGELPPQSTQLLDVVRLRWLAIDLGFTKIVIRSKKMICYFLTDQESDYYQSPAFSRILQYVQFNPKDCRMKEANDKLSLIFEDVISVAMAIGILSKILDD